LKGLRGDEAEMVNGFIFNAVPESCDGWNDMTESALVFSRITAGKLKTR